MRQPFFYSLQKQDLKIYFGSCVKGNKRRNGAEGRHSLWTGTMTCGKNFKIKIFKRGNGFFDSPGAKGCEMRAAYKGAYRLAEHL